MRFAIAFGIHLWMFKFSFPSVGRRGTLVNARVHSLVAESVAQKRNVYAIVATTMLIFGIPRVR